MEFVDKHLEKFQLFDSAIRTLCAVDLNKVCPNRQKVMQNRYLFIRRQISRLQTNNSRHSGSKQYLTLPPIPVDLKAKDNKIGLKEFLCTKKPSNHYEKIAFFAYYLSQFNKKTEIMCGEILSCYEEVDEKKPSIRYKGWLEPGFERFSTRLTISGQNFVKFDLPLQKPNLLAEQPPQLSLNH